MNNNLVSVQGYVSAIPVDERQCRVAVTQDGREYRILPRAAGVDLADKINVMVEASGQLEEQDDTAWLTVRHYKAYEEEWDDQDI